MTTVNIGSNDLFGVPFPLVLADRFFQIYAGPDGQMQIDVFRWDPVEQTATYEVERSEPLQDNINTNPTGIVTFTRQPDGRFLFKFRPKPGASQIFGRVPVSDEIDVRISDHELVVQRGSTPIATLTRSTFVGVPIAIQVGADGSVGMGVSALPAGMKLVRRVS